MAQVDQELPRRESRHGRARGLDVVKVVRLQGKVAGRRSDVLGVAAALEPGETQETEHLVADGEVADVLGGGRCLRRRRGNHRCNRSSLGGLTGLSSSAFSALGSCLCGGLCAAGCKNAVNDGLNRTIFQ